MIDFKGRNCAELHERISESGQWVAEVDGVWQASSDADVQAIIDAFDVAALANARAAKVDALATAKRNSVVAPYSPGEMASWPIKRAEALAYQTTSNLADAPNLSIEANARGMALSTLVGKVLQDAARFAGIEAAIAGTSGRHRDAIKAMTTHEQIMAYDYSTGWPL